MGAVFELMVCMIVQVIWRLTRQSGPTAPVIRHIDPADPNEISRIREMLARGGGVQQNGGGGDGRSGQKKPHVNFYLFMQNITISKEQSKILVHYRHLSGRFSE